MLNVTLYSESSRFESQFPWMPSPTLLVAMSSLLLVISTSYAYLFLSANDPKKIHQLGGFSFTNAWAFFNKRHDFLRSNRNKTGHDLFSFNVFQYQVVATSGEEARKTFFNEKDLSLDQGHRILRGAVPGLKDVKMMSQNSSSTMLIKRLLKILRRDRLNDAVPTLFRDINRCTEAWGIAGKMDPFKDIYNLVFQMTIRLSTCDELATDAQSVQKISQFYWQFEKSITPAGLLLPWFPSSAKKHKEQSIKGLYDILSHYVDVRRKAKVLHSDPFDELIADGENNTIIVELALLIIFGGVVNTAMISCWCLFYLGANIEWKNKVVAEVRNLIYTYSNANSSQPIHQRLSEIPMSAWEDEVPIIECVIRETLRLAKNSAALRRNLADNLQIAGKTIDKGTFVVYSMEDVHLNERFYSEPFKFDPSRFNSPMEEDKQGHLLFLAWGGGRHICPGMKTAKLEIKMILALHLRI